MHTTAALAASFSDPHLGHLADWWQDLGSFIPNVPIHQGVRGPAGIQDDGGDGGRSQNGTCVLWSCTIFRTSEGIGDEIRSKELLFVGYRATCREQVDQMLPSMRCIGLAKWNLGDAGEHL